MIIKETTLDKTKKAYLGNKFLIANGLMGYRGTIDEDRKKEKVALNINGIYDKVKDQWCESINLYNPLYTIVEINDINNIIRPLNEEKIIDHVIKLNLATAEFQRKTTYQYQNNLITIKSKRFISFKNNHLLVLKYSIQVTEPIELIIKTGFDLDIWDLAGPHIDLNNYSVINNNQGFILEASSKEHHHQIKMIELISTTKEAVTLENKVNDKLDTLLHVYKLKLDPTNSFQFEKKVLVYIDEKEDLNDLYLSYKTLFNNHQQIYDQLYQQSYIKIDGSRNAQIAIDHAIYNLLIASPRGYPNKSIPARALSGQVYKGAVFWDTEMFMFDFYLHHDLPTAVGLIKYRINSLACAKQKAIEFGYQGAFYAWESTKDGYDECSLYNMTDAVTNKKLRTYFKDKQIHISGDCLYALVSYYNYTNDLQILLDGGLEMALEIAKFYASYLTYNHHTNTFDILDVTGPDEYHERVNNNAYTNKLVEFVFNKTSMFCDIIRKKDIDIYKQIVNITKTNDLIDQLPYLANNITKPKIVDHVIEQFTGYFDLETISLKDLLKRKKVPNEYLGGEHGIATPTKIIKQADVITMLYMFREDYDLETLRKNFYYYLPYTEHGSSLSHSMYALVACLINDPTYSYPYFLSSGLIDYLGKGKEYAGGIYIGGTHPASSGGAYLTIINGYALMQKHHDELSFIANLPKQIKGLKFNIIYKNYQYKVNITKKNAMVIKEAIND